MHSCSYQNQFCNVTGQCHPILTALSGRVAGACFPCLHCCITMKGQQRFCSSSVLALGGRTLHPRAGILAHCTCLWATRQHSWKGVSRPSVPEHEWFTFLIVMLYWACSWFFLSSSPNFFSSALFLSPLLHKMKKHCWEGELHFLPDKGKEPNCKF